MTDPTRLATLALALLLAASLPGCQDADADTASLTIDFPDPREDVRAKVKVPANGTTAYQHLMDWSAASGVQVAIAQFDFGRCLDAIDNIPQPGGCQPGAEGYWSLSIDGQESQVGMDQALVHRGDEVAWTYTALADGSTGGSGDGPALAVDPLAPTTQEMAMVTGRIDRAARISVTGADAIDVEAGDWMVHVALQPGRTPLLVTADDGSATTQVQVLAVRLASATFEARFTMAVPAHPDIRDTVWYDPDELASAPLYNGTPATHPPHANVHDLMVAWERQSGKAITYSAPASFGFGVDRIDGVGQPLTAAAPPYWCYKLNGESADLGISAQELRPGDMVTWDYAGCA